MKITQERQSLDLSLPFRLYLQPEISNLSVQPQFSKFFFFFSECGLFLVKRS